MLPRTPPAFPAQARGPGRRHLEVVRVVHPPEEVAERVDDRGPTKPAPDCRAGWSGGAPNSSVRAVVAWRAAELEASLATVRRDLEALSTAGIPP